jgi:hypothetical protein
MNDDGNELIQKGIVSVKKGNINVKLPRLRDHLSNKNNYENTIDNIIKAYKLILKEYRSVTYKCDIQSLSLMDLRFLDFLYQLFPAIFKEYPTNVVSRFTLKNSSNFYLIFNVLKPFLYLYYDRDELDQIIILK